MRGCKPVYDLLSLFVITSNNSYRFAERIFPPSKDGFASKKLREESLASTEQSAIIAYELAGIVLLTTKNVVNDPACALRTVA